MDWVNFGTVKVFALPNVLSNCTCQAVVTISVKLWIFLIQDDFCFNHQNELKVTVNRGGDVTTRPGYFVP